MDTLAQAANRLIETAAMLQRYAEARRDTKQGMAVWFIGGQLLDIAADLNGMIGRLTYGH